MDYNYLDLFHGIGGFALGAYWAGMKFKNHFCSDIEKYPVELYKLRFPDSIQLGDITKINFEKLKKDYPGEWILTGGFPCQDISVAGKGKGMIDEEGNKTRSGLWVDYWKGISILRPRFVIIENVRALLNRGLETVLSNLAEIGYNAEWQIISAENMGAPHKRERVWIVAYSNSDNFRCTANRKSYKGPKVYNGRGENKLDPRRKMAYSESESSSSSNNGKEQRKISESKQVEFRGSNSGKMRESNWTVEPAVGRLVNGLSGRVDRLKGLGNSIVPQIAELLFNQIKEKRCSEKE